MVLQSYIITVEVAMMFFAIVQTWPLYTTFKAEENKTVEIILSS